MKVSNSFNSNLFFVFEKITSDREMARAFSKCKTEDELYDFCIKIKNGYSREEWKQFVAVLFNVLNLHLKNDIIVLNDNLKNISGGTMSSDIKRKILSGTLSILTFLPTGQITLPGAYATDSSDCFVKKHSSNFEKIVGGIGAATVATVIGIYFYKRYYSNSNLSQQNWLRMNFLLQQLYRLEDFKTRLQGDPKKISPLAKHLSEIFNTLDNQQENVKLYNQVLLELFKSFECDNQQPGDVLKMKDDSELAVLLRKYNVHLNFDEIFRQAEPQSSDSFPDPLPHTESKKNTPDEKTGSSDSNPGIVNPKNLCYINSVLQQLYSIDAFKKKLYEGKDELDAFKEQLDEYKDTPASLEQFIGETGKKRYKSLLLRLHLCALFEKMDTKEETIPITLVEPVARDLGYNNKQDDVAAAIQNDTLVDLFSSYGLGDFWGYQYSVDKDSKSLEHIFNNTIHLFSEQEKTRRGEVGDADQFALLLNRAAADASNNPIKITTPVSVSELINHNNKRYHLTGIIVHRGVEAGSGHYVSYKRSPKSKQWYRYNDDEVSQVSFDEIEKEASENGIAFIYTAEKE